MGRMRIRLRKTKKRGGDNTCIPISELQRFINSFINKSVSYTIPPRPTLLTNPAFASSIKHIPSNKVSPIVLPNQPQFHTAKKSHVNTPPQLEFMTIGNGGKRKNKRTRRC